MAVYLSKMAATMVGTILYGAMLHATTTSRHIFKVVVNCSFVTFFC